MPDGPVTLDSQDIQVRLQAKPGWAAAQGALAVVVISTELTDDLLIEGLARELVHAIQNLRKELGCQYTDRIVVGVVTNSLEVRRAINEFADYIRAETLAIEVSTTPIAGVVEVELNLGGHRVRLWVKVASR